MFWNLITFPCPSVCFSLRTPGPIQCGTCTFGCSKCPEPPDKVGKGFVSTSRAFATFSLLLSNGHFSLTVYYARSGFPNKAVSVHDTYIQKLRIPNENIFPKGHSSAPLYIMSNFPLCFYIPNHLNMCLFICFAVVWELLLVDSYFA